MKPISSGDIILDVRDLCKHFPITKGLTRRRIGTVRAVDGVSFQMRRGEIFGLVGESGCGKTTTARTILRAMEATSGKVLFTPTPGASPIDLFALGRQELKAMRRQLRMIFQDPYSSLNPRMNVREILSEPLLIHGLCSSRKERDERIARILRDVGLDPSCMRRYAHAFSGGQRQRIGIARALILQPSFVVADEAVSALDVSVQAQILNLLRDLRDRYALTYLFIAHNLAVVEHFCERLGVMYVGKLVEMGRTHDLFHRPRHPYTEALLAAVPRSEPGPPRRRELLPGEVADPARPPPGCMFHPRCKMAVERCATEAPPLVDVADEGEAPHWVACHRATELCLRGVGEGAG